MKLITAAILKKLKKNFETGNDEDIVLKLFNPTGAGTWLITQIEENGDTMWGLADLGFGCVEYGTMSLSEMKAVRLPLGLKIERDMHYYGGKVSEMVGKTSLSGC